MTEQLRPINGQQRAAARLAAIREKNDAIMASWPEREPSRQVRRRWERGVTTHRALKPSWQPPRDRTDAHILRRWVVGATEFAFHATKGLRVRRA